jgi:hypothetical protein
MIFKATTRMLYKQGLNRLNSKLQYPCLYNILVVMIPENTLLVMLSSGFEYLADNDKDITYMIKDLTC